MHLIEKQQEDGDGRKLYRTRLCVGKALNLMGEVSRDGNLLWPTIRLVELLHSRRLLSDSDVFTVFGIDESKWEVDK